MAHIITITSSARAVVISEKIVDGGRERFENGRDELEPGVPQDFLAHEGQSLRVVVLPPVEAASSAEADEQIGETDVDQAPESVTKLEGEKA